MKVLLSIKPEFTDKIFNGEKLFEFRRTIFKQDVKYIIIYSSSPIKKVIGEVEIDEVIHDDLENLWLKTEKSAGISKKYYIEYFKGKQKGFAIKLKNITKYESPLCIKEHFKKLPPQSFTYV